MITRKLKRAEAQAKPYSIWNAYVDLLAHEDYEDLNEVQRPPHLVFWYESEIQNGGHLQYFENRGDKQVDETIDALRKLQVPEHANILKEAVARWRQRERERIETAADFCEEALSDEFGDLNTRFYRSTPLIDALKQYLAEYQGSFVLIE